MRILIDECEDERLRHEFAEHDCQTGRFAGYAGLKNGQLLDAAEAAAFEVLITVDKNIPLQQNLTSRKISILILRVSTNRLSDLLSTVPEAIRALAVIQPEEVLTSRDD
jgi:predicted nuclease of predicted toxin-antitoxin system